MNDIVERLRRAKWEEDEDSVVELKNFLLSLDAADYIEELEDKILPEEVSRKLKDS